MISLAKKLRKNNFSQISILLLLLILLIIGTLPGYIQGKWQWQEPPPIPQLGELKKIRRTGLTVSGWKTIEQTQKEIGQQKWSLQIIKNKNQLETLIFFQ